MSLSIHCDTNIGQNDSGVTVREITNGHGQHYFEASTTITHLFGQEISGSCPIIGIGATRELAIERLQKELKEFNDSLWFEFPKDEKGQP
jgi:hypothetical protein